MRHLLCWLLGWAVMGMTDANYASKLETAIAAPTNTLPTPGRCEPPGPSQVVEARLHRPPLGPARTARGVLTASGAASRAQRSARWHHRGRTSQ